MRRLLTVQNGVVGVVRGAHEEDAQRPELGLDRVGQEALVGVKQNSTLLWAADARPLGPALTSGPRARSIRFHRGTWPGVSLTRRTFVVNALDEEPYLSAVVLAKRIWRHQGWTRP
jgi:hypothetical protein